MIHASLFSGIGGPEVAAAMMGWENAFHCEINPFGRAVLDYWFPESKSYEDITKTDFREWRGKIDILTGGFPCQPFSYAGKRGGADDNRYLWPQMLRAIDEIRPTWVVGENVAGLATMVEGGVLADLGYEATLFGEVDGVHRFGLRSTFTIERICRDLENHGYSVQPVLIPAAAVGAPHRRDRIFILAYAENTICDGCRQREYGEQGHQRNERNAGAGDDERVCGEKRADATNAEDLQRDGRIAGHEGKYGRESLPELGNRSRKDATTNTKGWNEGQEFGEYECGGGREKQIRGNHICEAENAIDSVCIGWRDSREHDNGEPSQPQQERCGEIESCRADSSCGWWRGFPTQSPVHRGNDGLPFDVDDLSISFSKWRTESLKAYGNAIVPQVMYRIFQAISKSE